MLQEKRLVALSENGDEEATEKLKEVKNAQFFNPKSGKFHYSGFYFVVAKLCHHDGKENRAFA